MILLANANNLLLLTSDVVFASVTDEMERVGSRLYLTSVYHRLRKLFLPRKLFSRSVPTTWIPTLVSRDGPGFMHLGGPVVTTT